MTTYFRHSIFFSIQPSYYSFGFLPSFLRLLCSRIDPSPPFLAWPDTNHPSTTRSPCLSLSLSLFCCRIHCGLSRVFLFFQHMSISGCPSGIKKYYQGTFMSYVRKLKWFPVEQTQKKKWMQPRIVNRAKKASLLMRLHVFIRKKTEKERRKDRKLAWGNTDVA